MKRLIALCAVLAVSAVASADYGVSVSGNGSHTSGDWTLGYQFTVGDDPLEVTALGYFDLDQNGFASDHEVGIWKTDGTLVTSAIVGSGDTLDGWFRYADVASAMLDANTTYKVAGTTGADDYSWENPGFVVGPGLTYETDVFKSGGFGFPDSSEGRGIGNSGIFGGNFAYRVVPEPGTLGLLTIGLAGIAARRRNG